MKNKYGTIKPIGQSPNSKAMQDYKTTLSQLTPEQKDAVIGGILGDISIGRGVREDGSFRNRLKFEWGNLAYCQHIYDLFEEGCLEPPVMKVRYETGVRVVTWAFQSISHSAFDYLGKLFLIKAPAGTKRKGLKIVPKGLVLDHLTPQGLAYWGMDDGGQNSYKDTNKAFTLNTHDFTEAEVIGLSQELNQKGGLSTWHKKKHKGIIVIGTKDHDKFIELIGPYIVDCMRYKLPKCDR